MQVTYPVQELESVAFENVCEHLLKLGTITTLTTVLDLEVESTIRNIIVPKFWKHFCSESKQDKPSKEQVAADLTDKDGMFVKFIDAIDELYDGYRCLQEVKERLARLNKTTVSSINNDSLKTTLRNALLAGLPPTFNSFVRDFYCVHYRLFTKDSSLASTTIGKLLYIIMYFVYIQNGLFFTRVLHIYSMLF